MSHLYEGKIQNMGNAGRNGGEYYTPRPLIRTIIKTVSPQIGNKIYDGAAIQNVASVKILKGIKIPLPTLDAQQSIVQKLNTLSTEIKKLENIYQQKLNDLEKLKKSVLQKAFNGELKNRKKSAV